MSEEHSKSIDYYQTLENSKIELDEDMMKDLDLRNGDLIVLNREGDRVIIRNLKGNLHDAVNFAEKKGHELGQRMIEDFKRKYRGVDFSDLLDSDD